MPKARHSIATIVLAIANGALPAAAQQPKPMPANDFVMAAAGSDQYEIVAAQVALIESKDPRVRGFAQQMIQDHTMTSQSLQQAATASGMPAPPRALTDDGEKMLTQLQSVRGPEFDQKYKVQQVLAHYQALIVEQSYAATGSDPNVRQAARSALPVIQHHLDMARQLAS